MSETEAKLRELKATAERLIIGEVNARWIRGLFVELCGALLGEHQNHPDVESTGARYTPPAFTGSMPAPPVAGLAAPAQAIPPPGAPGSPGVPRRLTLQEGAAIAAARKASPAAAPATEPVNGAADPAGPGFLKRLEDQLQQDE